MDNGKQFTSKQLNDLAKKYGITKLWYNSFYHPQNNFTERTNRTIGNALRSYSRENQRYWDKYIPQITLALRTAVHDVTGYSPFFLNFARDCPLSATDYTLLQHEPDVSVALSNRCAFLNEFAKIYNDVSSLIRKSYDKNKLLYDKNRIEQTFEVGDIVYRKNHPQSNASNFVSAKLFPKNTKCIIVNKRSNLSYDLVDTNGRPMGNYHVKDLTLE